MQLNHARSYRSGRLADAESWTKLWKAWRFEKEQPAIDFTKHVVLVSVARAAVNRWKETGLKLTDKGNLRPEARATEIAGPGFIGGPAAELWSFVRRLAS